MSDGSQEFAEARAVFERGRQLEAESPSEALQYFARSAALAPDWVEPVIALGDLFRGQGRAQEALVAYGRAAELAPDDAALLVKRGNLLGEARDFDGAVKDYETASQLQPDWHLPYLNLGNTFAAQDRPDDARAAYDRALAAGGPAGIALRRELLLPVIPRSRDAYAAAHAAFETALARLALSPPSVENPLAETPASRFFLAYHGAGDRALQEQLAALYLAACPALAWTSPHCSEAERSPGPRRIALVCRFLFDHSIGRLLLGLLQRLAAGSECEMMIFESAAAPDDPVRREIDAAVASRVLLPRELDAARERIAGFQPDVVFFPEVGMDPMTYFLAFARLAPVQAVTWGHPITTGVPNVDYFLSCDGAEPTGPQDAEGQYSEALVRLDGYPFSYPRPPMPAPAGERAGFDLPEDANLYFLAQNLFKIHPDMDAALRQILEGDPKGCLVLLEGHDPGWGEAVRARFAATLGEKAARVVFLARQSHDDYMRLLSLADVVLDSYPFSGGNTTYQAIAMGAPVVTCPGRYLRGRFSMATFERMGVPELIAGDMTEFADIALRLGTDDVYRREIQERLTQASDAIFDDPIYLGEMERFLMTAVPR